MAYLHLVLLFLYFLLVGVPLARLLCGRQPSSALLLLAFPLGIAFVTIVLQFSFVLKFPLRFLYWPFNTVVAVGCWILLGIFRSPEFRNRIRLMTPIIGTLVLILLLGSLAVFSPNGHYYGRAWGDQLNYT